MAQFEAEIAAFPSNLPAYVSLAVLQMMAGRETDAARTLRQLTERTRSLERAFFALTGTDEPGLRSAGQEMGAMR